MAARTAKYSERHSKNSHIGRHSLMEVPPVQDLLQSVSSYVRKNPESAALWCFGIGFVLGWKLKPW